MKLKSLKVATAIVAILMALAGCANPGGSVQTSAPAVDTTTAAATATPAATASAAEATTAAAVEPTQAPDPFQTKTHELVWYTDGWPDGQDDLPIVMQAMNKRFADMGYPGLTVNLKGFDWGSFTEKMNAIVASGEQFDITEGWTWALNYTEFLSNGAFLPWDDYVPSVPAWNDQLKDVLDKVKDIGPDGTPHVYRIPVIKEWASIPAAIRFNKTVSDKLGITDGLNSIKTAADLTPYLEQYKAAYPKGMAFVAVDAGALVSSFADGVGVSYFAPYFDQKLDKYTCGMYEDWGKQYVDLLRGWHSKGYIPDYELDAGQAGDLFGKFGAESFLAYCNTGKPADTNELDAATVSQYGYTNGEVYISNSVIGKENILGNAFTLSKTSSDPATAAFMYGTICSDAGLTNLIDYGIEGTHYTKNSDGSITRTDKTTYWPNMTWHLGNKMLAYVLQGMPTDLGALYKDFNASAYIPSNDGFAMPDYNAAGKFNMDAFNTQAQAVDKQYTRKVLCGTIKDSELADAKSKLESVGIKDLLALENADYQAWKATKK